MMALELITNYNQAGENIHRYNLDLPNSPVLQSRLNTHRAWYYNPLHDEIAPSKFIGFIGMSGDEYSTADGSIFDGGRTELALSEYFDVITVRHKLYNKIDQQLRSLLRKYNKSPRSDFRLNIPKIRYLRKQLPKRKRIDWVKDELILALDLYFRLGHIPSDKNHPEIIKLSELLNKLPIHPISRRPHTFRNRNGVYMKLGNFLRLDPSYSGEGLPAGSKVDKVVWDQFANNRSELSLIAENIRKNYQILNSPHIKTEETEINEDEEFPEGSMTRRLHTVKDRNPKAVKQKKAKVLRENGRLNCEACGFDYYDYYGEQGRGFAECHHRDPHASSPERVIKISDLAIVCANCHRILHRIRPWHTVEMLKELLVGRGKI